MAVLLSGDGMRGEQGGSRETGQRDPPAPWVAFVGALPRRFAPPITTVPAEGPSAEWFDRSLPRHPPEGGPGARRMRLRSARARASSLFRVNGSLTVNGSLPLYQIPQRACRFTGPTHWGKRPFGSATRAAPVPRACTRLRTRMER